MEERRKERKMGKNDDSICCFRSREESRTKRVCWEITTDCNLNCPFCHRYGFDAEYYEIGRLPETIALLKAQGIENVILSGGEPLLHPHFFSLLERLQEAGFELDVCTNGVLLDPVLADRLSRSLSEISISLDGYGPERHERMRRSEGCFARTMEGVDLLLKKGMEVHMTTVVDAAFAGEIVRMTDFLYQKGIRSVAYLGLIPLDTGRNPLFEPDCQALLSEQIARARERYPDMSINTKQLLLGQSRCRCGAGSVIWGLGTDGLTLHPCLLTRERPGKKENGGGPGMCPGSRYLTQKREEHEC